MIYTFYSFKGGVGRSMALANVAELLYRYGMKVLMVDLDLEAPGLERYFNVPEAAYNPHDVLDKRGLIDMLISYKKLYSLPRLSLSESNTYADSSSQQRFSFPVEPLKNFIVPIYESGNNGGTLHIIPAGNRAGDEFTRYSEKVRSFDWDNFYSEWKGEEFFEWFRCEAESFADVVLIDSRTGVTEMGGVCTYQLADVVVMFVAPNQQNIDGTLMIAKSLVNSDLIQEGRKGRELSLLFVPSRVENAEKKLLDNFETQFTITLNDFIRAELKFEISAFIDLKLPYVPYYAYMERVAVRDVGQASASDLVEAYRRLTFTLAQLAPEAAPLRKRLLGEEHSDAATDLSNLAGRYYAQGRYSEAEPLYVQALALRKRLLGEEHPDVATTLNSLANLYNSQGRYSEAEPLYVQALALRKRLLGEEHPAVATSMNNLAELYYSQGRYKQAQLLMIQALELRKNLLGEEHPDVATSLNNLAALYYSQGRYKKTELLYQQALAIYQRSLGDKHLDVSNSLNNLAELYKSQERYTEAEPLYIKTLDIRKRLLGEEHPAVATSINNLAELYKAQGRYAEAEPLYTKSLELREYLLGEKHPDVAVSLNNLAELYKAQGRYTEAEPLYVRALNISEQILGTEHPYTTIFHRNLEQLRANQEESGLFPTNEILHH
jgi:tetratricopeptide (TPR) repeat protein